MRKRERELLLAAKTLFSRRGFYDTTVSDIVESLGIARGTFYQYFKNKDDIYRRVLEQVVEELSSRLKLVSPDDPFAQLRENLKGVLELMVEDRDLARLVFYHPYKLNPRFDAVLEEFFLKVYALVEHAVKTGMEMGVVRRCNPEIVARAIVGAFMEVGKLLIEQESPDIEGAVDELLAIGRAGLLEER
ncbi:TetR/AcrR family transcriptional regulator [Thermovibrio ammonificans]|uniref:Transcriptional regulator, TetR family n=1 Tax=Thermovibrio ammonificans (strain DSM 15698 / JCM 12110 / HB-1) TaxID=648996 RepID=E8T665_THEA1|nr:TetR/AcrR family transcriptional regulator [Thermovibrio ammonificans]ADU96649.1 transcriptional regulator, TetR family [Thermovibrio ammonificans HB-1]